MQSRINFFRTIALLIALIGAVFGAAVTSANDTQMVDLQQDEIMQQWVDNMTPAYNYRFQASENRSLFVLLVSAQIDDSPQVTLWNLTDQVEMARFRTPITSFCVRIAPGMQDYAMSITQSSSNSMNPYRLMLIEQDPSMITCPADAMSNLAAGLAFNGFQSEEPAQVVDDSTIETTLVEVTTVDGTDDNGGSDGTDDTTDPNDGGTDNENPDDGVIIDVDTSIGDNGVDIDVDAGIGGDDGINLDVDVNAGGDGINLNVSAGSGGQGNLLDVSGIADLGSPTCFVTPVNTALVNVRSLADTDASVLGGLQAGVAAPVLGKVDGQAWLLVNMNDTIGFVSSSALGLVGECASVPVISVEGNAVVSSNKLANLTLNMDTLDADIDMDAVLGEDGVTLDLTEIIDEEGSIIDVDAGIGDDGVDAGVDAGIGDDGVDVGVDAGIGDDGVDAGVDVGVGDDGVDAGVDAGIGDDGVDAGVDVGVGDDGIDAGVDVGAGDTGVNLGVEAGTTPDNGGVQVGVEVGTNPDNGGTQVGVTLPGTQVGVGLPGLGG